MKDGMILILMALGVLLWIWLVATRSHADRAPSDAELLSRIAVSESGWDSPADHTAIAAVLRNRQGRGTFRRIAMAYSSRVTGAKPPLSRRQAWVSGLSASLRRPAAWPGNVAWAPYRARWRRVLARSRAILAGELGHKCEAPPGHWGNAQDVRRFLVSSGGWHVTDCGGTRNLFLARGR